MDTVNSIIDTKKGFTLLEVVAVLILTSILGVVAALGYGKAIEGMEFTKVNAATVQKGQIVMTKLIKEFNNISDVSTAHSGSSQITFKSVKNAESDTRRVMFSEATHTIIFDNKVLTDPVTGAISVDPAYNGILMDQVSSFTLRYYKNYYTTEYTTTWQPSTRVIEITLKMMGANNVQPEFKARVRPRNFERRI